MLHRSCDMEEHPTRTARLLHPAQHSVHLLRPPHAPQEGPLGTGWYVARPSITHNAYTVQLCLTLPRIQRSCLTLSGSSTSVCRSTSSRTRSSSSLSTAGPAFASASRFVAPSPSPLRRASFFKPSLSDASPGLLRSSRTTRRRSCSSASCSASRPSGCARTPTPRRSPRWASSGARTRSTGASASACGATLRRMSRWVSGLATSYVWAGRC